MNGVLTESAQRVRRNLMVFGFGLLAFSTPWVKPADGGDINLFASGIEANPQFVFLSGWALVAYSLYHFWLQAKDSEHRLKERHNQTMLAAAIQYAELTDAYAIVSDLKKFEEIFNVVIGKPFPKLLVDRGGFGSAFGVSEAREQYHIGRWLRR